MIPEILTRAEIYDPLGFLAFLFIAISAFWMLKRRKALPKAINIILLVIAILGVIVDGTIVYTKFLS
jgi:uncharacterized membrane protein